MITLLCYFWFLMWHIENTDKAFFASLSTFEIAIEIFLSISIICYFINEWFYNRRAK